MTTIDEILEGIREHGNWAFVQGRKSHMKKIPMEDNARLARMEEGQQRAMAFVKVAKAIKELVGDTVKTAY
jgi:hypothetical protein